MTKMGERSLQCPLIIGGNSVITKQHVHPMAWLGEMLMGKPPMPVGAALGLCCTNRLKDSLCESSVIAMRHEQLGPHEIQDQELVILQ